MDFRSAPIAVIRARAIDLPGSTRNSPSCAVIE